MRCTPEEVGYWYLRLNGFLTTANFIVHPDEPGGHQLTDIDALGVRFPYRAEMLREPMQDDEIITVENKPLIIICEIKTGSCRINNSLRNADNINRILRAIGVFPEEQTQNIAQAIRNRGSYDSDQYRVSVLCLGDEDNPDLARQMPELIQVNWTRVLSFMYRRFERYRNRKAEHDQWDGIGHLLWNAAAQIRDEEDFIRFIKMLWQVQ